MEKFKPIHGETPQEDPYAQEVRQAVHLVIGYYLQPELKVLDETDQQETIEKMLPIYYDAVGRGHTSVMTDLEANKPVQVSTGMSKGIRQYTLTDDELTWRIVPTNEDPFLKLQFIKEARAKGNPLNGISDPFTDPLLINEMFKRGVNEQDRLFQAFITTHRQSVSAMKNANSTTRYLPSLQDSFDTLSYMHKVVEDTATDDQDKKIQFLRMYGSELDVEKLSSIQHMTEHALLLNTFFNSSSGATIIPDNKQPYESSLAVQMALEPTATSDLSSFRQPVTTIEKATNLIAFLYQEYIKKKPEEYAYLIRSLSKNIVQEQEATIERVFSTEDIDPQIAQEFLENMIYSQMKRLGENFEEIGYDATNHVVNHEKMHGYFNIKRKPQPSISRPRYTTRTSERDIIERFTQRKVFESSAMQNYTPEAQKSILKRIISTQDSDKVNRERVIHNLFDRLKLSFSPRDKLFVSKISDEDEPDFNKWLTDTQINSLNIIAESITSGDEQLGRFVEDIVIKSHLRPYLSRKKLPSKLQAVDKAFFNQTAKGNKDKIEDKVLKVIDASSAYFLSATRREDLNKPRLNEEQILTNLVHLAGRHKLIDLPVEMENPGRLIIENFPDPYKSNLEHIFTLEKFKQSVMTRSKEMFQECQEEIDPEFSTYTQAFILKTLTDSIDMLSNKEQDK